jgi:nucleotide-binding universal stress UspA family protein
MYGRILVGIDGSEMSDAAVTEALKLAKAQRANVRLVHAAEVLPPAGLEPSYIDYELFRQSALKAGRAFVHHAESLARHAGHDVESAVVEVSAHDISGAIIEDAVRWRADLIVIGTHGRSGLERIFLGSVAESVARHAPVPVLLVKRPAQAKPAAARTRKTGRPPAKLARRSRRST